MNVRVGLNTSAYSLGRVQISVLEETFDTRWARAFLAPPSLGHSGGQFIRKHINVYEVGRMQKEKKHAQVSGTTIMTFSNPSTFSHSCFCHILREKQDIFAVFICFPRAVYNRQSYKHMQFNDRVRRQMTIPVCPLSWPSVDWQDTSILHMPFLYRDLIAVKVLLEFKLPYKPAGIRTPNKSSITSLFLLSRLLDS